MCGDTKFNQVDLLFIPYTVVLPYWYIWSEPSSFGYCDPIRLMSDWKVLNMHARDFKILP